ncbi:ATPase, T2SS/T4P/T4SS family [uncultured Tateyamaria sp.]
MACRAVLVGRMVLSTLHTSSLEEAVARLVDLGCGALCVECA